jgi:ribonuclease
VKGWGTYTLPETNMNIGNYAYWVDEFSKKIKHGYGVTIFDILEYACDRALCPGGFVLALDVDRIMTTYGPVLGGLITGTRVDWHGRTRSRSGPPAPCPNCFEAGEILGDPSKLGGWTPTEVPPESMRVVLDIRRNGVEAQGAGDQHAGPTVPKTYENDSAKGGYTLPEFDSAGNSITYREWGTVQSTSNPKPGGERIVTGSDGSIYYSPTHYQYFIVVVPGR